MINGIKKGTIVSTTEDRLTLLQWLKKLEKTLSDDTLADIAFTDDNGNVSLVLTFEDGTTKSVAFPYDMSTFAKKSEIMLEDRGTLDIRDTSKFDIEETQTSLDAYLKVNLENGIYHLDTSSLHEEQDNCINFHTKSLDILNYKYLQIIQPLQDGVGKAFLTDGYCNGLGEPAYVYLDKNFSQNAYKYVIIINNGIVIFTVAENA